MSGETSVCDTAEVGSEWYKTSVCDIAEVGGEW